MKNPLISIVIPVYNVEKYLVKCLNSVISQTYENLEIILIDDGSKDSSSKICNSYSKKDLRIKVVHKVNEGVAIARNVGIANASGKYITFIDSDDYIEKRYIENLYNLCNENDSDISICGVATEFLNGKITKSLKFKNCVTGKEAIQLMLNKKYFGWTCWAKMYKLEKIKYNKFKPKVRIAEDVEFLYNVLKITQKVNIDTSFCMYHYVKRKGSATCVEFNDDRKKELLIYKEMKSDMGNFLPESQRYIEAWYFKRVVFALYLIKRTTRDKEELNVLKNEIKQMNLKWITNKNINLKDKLKYILI